MAGPPDVELSKADDEMPMVVVEQQLVGRS